MFFPPHRKIVIKIGKKKKRKPESSEESDDDPPPRHSSKDVDSVRLYTDTRRWTQTDVWCTSEYLTGVWNLHPELWDGACWEFAFIWLFFFICCGVTSLPKANWRSVFGLTVGAAAEPRRKASGFRFWAPAGSSVWFRWRSYSGLGYLKVHILICVDDGDVKQIAPSRAHAHTSTAAGEDDMLQVFFSSLDNMMHRFAFFKCWIIPRN